MIKKRVVKKKQKTPKTPTKPKRKPRRKKALSRPEAFKEFVNWMSTPEPLRKIKTQGLLAKGIGVCPDTLSDWKKRDDFWKEVQKVWNQWGKEKTANVIISFYRRIIGGKAAAGDFKLWFQYFLGWAEKNEANVLGEIRVIHEFVEPAKPKTPKKNVKRHKSKT